jgi:hypothetical protein
MRLAELSAISNRRIGFPYTLRVWMDTNSYAATTVDGFLDLTAGCCGGFIGPSLG